MRLFSFFNLSLLNSLTFVEQFSFRVSVLHLLDHSSEHSPTTKCPADSTEEARPTTVNTTSTVKKSNNRDKVAIGCTSKEKQFKNIDNAIENYRNNKS